MRGERAVVLRFGRFTLDTASRQLARQGTSLHLTPKAFDLLVLLASEAPRVVTKSEIHETLWPDTYVSDATLVGLVKELRRTLDDRDRELPLIRTAHRVGYAFCPSVSATVSARHGPVWHWLVFPGRRVALQEGENIVGRDPVCGVRIDASGVSRRHARIVIDRGGVRLEDLGSKNGTRVGDAWVAAAVDLQDGDRIVFGPAAGLYRRSSSGLSTETRTRSALESKARGARS
jgi:DNA-binding winged helix-turn-helix (wHTH) protein